MERPEFLNLAIGYQRAAYNIFSPGQREALWTEKLSEVLEFNWSKEERLHIEALKNLCTRYNGVFSENFPEDERDCLEIDIYRWGKYAITELGWSKKLMSAILSNPNKMADKTGLIISHVTPRANGTDSSISKDPTPIQPSCECSTMDSESFLIADCDMANGGCHGARCDGSGWGCGLLWGSSCNGMCY